MQMHYVFLVALAWFLAGIVCGWCIWSPNTPSSAEVAFRRLWENQREIAKAINGGTKVEITEPE